MNTWRRLTGWLSARWSRARYERELDEELRAHRDLEIEALIDAGVPPAEARRRVQRQFVAHAVVIKDASREAWGWGVWDRLAQDLRGAWRLLRRQPGFTLVAVASLALGIGANTAVFSLLDAVALRTLPVHEPDRLVRLVRASPRGHANSASVALYDMIRAHNDVFASVAQFSTDYYTVRAVTAAARHDGAPHDDAGRATSIWGQAVTGTYHDTLGLRPWIGRLLTPADEVMPRPAAVAVLGYAYWQRQFNGDPAVLGRTLLINDLPHTIVGITPPAFFGLQPGNTIDVTIPRARPARDDRDGWSGMPIVARLKPDVGLERASAEVDAIFQPFIRATAMAAIARHAGWRLTAIPLATGFDWLRSEYLQPLVILAGLVVLVLLLACANVAGLLLVRGVARQREMAIRAALGAGSWRVARMLLIESLLLAAFGAAAGLLLAWIGVDALLAILPGNGHVALTLDVTPNARVLAFTSLVTIASALLVGLAPAWRLTRRQPPALFEHARVAAPSRRGSARAVVVAQMAIALVLVCSATLLVRSLRNIRGVDGGFERPGIVLLTIDVERSGYDAAQLLARDRDLRERLRALPGVDRVASSTLTPLSGADETRAIVVPGYAPPNPHEPSGALVNYVSDGFFALFRVPLLRGRALDARDLREPAPDVAVVSERFAQQYFAGADPIGRTFSTLAAGARTFTIIGVARDVRHTSLRAEPEPSIYVPLSKRHAAPRQLRIGLHSATPETTMSEARRLVQQSDPDALLLGVTTLEREVDQRLVRERLLAGLSGLFGGMALLLAAIGMYGLLAHSVSRRTSEIGVRLALGATRTRIVWTICREGVTLAAAGIAIGLAIAAAAARLLAHALEPLLFGLRADDLATTLAASLMLLGVALAAGALPARRAARVDPLIALRHE